MFSSALHLHININFSMDINISLIEVWGVGLQGTTILSWRLLYFYFYFSKKLEIYVFSLNIYYVWLFKVGHVWPHEVVNVCLGHTRLIQY